MTRVVVPRSNAPTTSSQSRNSATAAAIPVAAPGTSVIPPCPPLPPSALPSLGCSSSSGHQDDSERAAADAPPTCSSDVESAESPSRTISQLGPRLGSIRLEDPNASGKIVGGDAEGAKESAVSAYQSDKVSETTSQLSSTVSAFPDGSGHEAHRTGTPQQQHTSASGTSSSARGAPSSRRGSFTGPRPSFVAQRISRTSPTSSHSTSPRALAGEGDGYNSADESASWSSGQPGFEEDEDKESHFEIEIRRVKALEVKRMLPDGNCLFRAVADQVYGDPEMYTETRQMCLDYMERERDHFSQFVTEGFTAYCKRKRRDKVYGNNLEIQAMAEMYNRPIHIYSYSTDPINTFHGQYQTDLPPIRLSYHRRNHYNSLHDPSRSAVGAGLGFGSLRGTNVDGDQVKAAIRAQQDQQIENALVAEGRYYSDLELTEQEIERMVMEASRAEYLAHRQIHPSADETSSSAGGEPSSSGAASRGSGSAGASQFGGSVNSATVDTAVSRNSNVRLLLSMGFNYIRVMEASSIFGDDVNNMLCYLLETDSLGENAYRMKGKAAEK